MSDRNVIEFLRMVATQKDEVITTTEQVGYPFTEAEFDPLIWGLEAYLAEKRGEKFDSRLFSPMWGKYYLEFLVVDLILSFTEADFDAVMAGGVKGT
jgi:hypothetical protein